jgi:hypothetical protein
MILAETVRQTMQFAATGNVDAALTSWTLVHDQGGILLPDSLRQAGVVIRGSARAADAAAVLGYLRGSEGQGILGRHGLLPGDSPGDALLQNLKDNDGNGEGGGTDKQSKKAEGLGPTQKRNKHK